MRLSRNISGKNAYILIIVSAESSASYLFTVLFTAESQPNWPSRKKRLLWAKPCVTWLLQMFAGRKCVCSCIFPKCPSIWLPWSRVHTALPRDLKLCAAGAGWSWCDGTACLLRYDTGFNLMVTLSMKGEIIPQMCKRDGGDYPPAVACAALTLHRRSVVASSLMKFSLFIRTGPFGAKSQKGLAYRYHRAKSCKLYHKLYMILQ